MKNRFLILLAGLLVLAATAFATGAPEQPAAAAAVKVNPPPTFPIVAEKITLRGFGRLDPQHGPWDKMTLWIDHEARTNIHIEWETPGQDNVQERKNLILASGDLPDFFIKTVLSDSDLIQYGSDGALIPLEPYMERWAPGLNALIKTYPETKSAITAPGGHVYGFPRVTDFLPGLVWRSPLMNMTWLQRLGLKAPTTDREFLAVMRAFRDKDANGNGDPKDEVPYSSHNPDFALMGVAGMFGVRYDIDYDRRYPISLDDKGKLHIQLADPAYRDAMRYYATLFQEKLLDQEIFTHTNKDYFGKLAAGRMGFTPLYQPRNAATFANEYDAIVPPKGPKGDQFWNFLQPRVQNVNSFSITSWSSPSRPSRSKPIAALAISEAPALVVITKTTLRKSMLLPLLSVSLP